MAQTYARVSTSKVLRQPWFSTAIWSLLLLLSFIMVLHNVFLQTWGIGTFPSITRRVEEAGEQGGFNSSPLLDAEGRPSILAYARTPAGRLMHILPAGLWSVIAPLQLSPSFRAKHRTAHRRLGRLFMSMSISMSFGLVFIIRNTYGGKSVVSGAVMLAGGGYFLVAGLLAVRHARNKRIADHRVWMLRHVAMGYTVHMLRLIGPTTWWIFPGVVPGYTDLTHEGEHLRYLVFTAYFIIGAFLTVVPMEVWLRHTSSSGKVLREGQERDIPAKKAE